MLGPADGGVLAWAGAALLVAALVPASWPPGCQTDGRLTSLRRVDTEKRRALVLEPNDALRQVLAEALRELGFEVFASEARKQGLLQFLLSHPDVDLVMVDLVDSAADGEPFGSSLAALAEAASIPLIWMTDGTRPRTFAPGAVCLAKPFDLEELLAAVRASMLDATPRSRASTGDAPDGGAP